MFKEERQVAILQIIEREGRASVMDLAVRLQVNEETVRRDLRELKEQGLILKTHGGALKKMVSAPPYETRIVQAAEVKEAIGRRAAELVEENDSIIIDSGTTTLYLARALPVRRVRIITNSLEIARVLLERPEYEMILLGGRYDPVHREVTGPATVEQLSRYRADKLFMGMTALNPEDGITDVCDADAALKQMMIRVSRQVIGLADHNKFGKVACHWVAPSAALDVLVTDEETDCSGFTDVKWTLIQVPAKQSTGK